MSVFKCKMCGGDLNLEQGSTVAVCEYCGSRQTVPSADDEKKMTLFGRANRLLRSCEFDKASGIFESIVADFPEEAEAYWGLVLCKYGIEYVDDPATGKKVPTCHRSSFDSVMDDPDFEQAVENADAIARKIYREEAKQIEELRKSIIEISGKEEPYDIFISYKETDDSGERTIDSVLAQDIYDELTEKGYRVFFSRISLEDKLGTEYEPYIFAALNSAKLMIVVGTDYDYFNAVWVKNEWSRFIKLMAQDKSKHLIPCFKSIDAYDLPKEFAKLAAQDLGKVGAMQDLLRGIGKLLGRKETQAVNLHTTNASNTEPLVKRAFMFLEEQNWKSADEYSEKILDLDPENAQAYVVKLLTDLHLKTIDGLDGLELPFDNNANYSKILKYADSKLKDSIQGYNNRIVKRIEEREKHLKIIPENVLSAIIDECSKQNANTFESENTLNQLLDEIKSERDNKKDLEQKLSKLGIFKMAEKAEVNNQIAIAAGKISKAEAEVAAIKNKISFSSMINKFKINHPEIKTDESISYERAVKELKTRKNVKEKLIENYPELSGLISSIGNTIEFGHYANNPIEWIILEKGDDKALLLSKCILLKHPFSNNPTCNVWKGSDLFSYLNSVFLKDAFSDNEKEKIFEDDSIGNVFILAQNEISNYLRTDEERIAFPLTQYEKKNEGIRALADTFNNYWLRGPIATRQGGLSSIPMVIPKGAFSINMPQALVGVRPAIWLKLDD